ncbi:hypothetical protein TCAL_17164 [Tigriopus californicus]|uniref:Single domain-containing protein n=2 Tax=Tigriopus californicus TaxID=6832 RepID=A0A553N7H3_TIGCA|nr:hypothetical protein TCAL_17164 [Tigriopus californicus]
MCFASTQCKVFAVDDSWSLAPFCGRASCRIVETKDKEGEDKKFLAEQVEDCGPLIDLEATTGCELLTVEDQAELEFPDCCPQYDCAEGTEIIYVNATTPATR